jgi:putative ATP-binding cassette transporter
LARIEAIGISLGEAPSPKVGPEAPAWSDRISLRGVTHTYYRERDDRQFVLGPLDLDLKKGEMLFIVGGNGSGKSTLAKLLAGLYEPEAGAILVDGVAIDDQRREAYRHLFSAVFSDFYLFERLLGADLLEEDARRYLVELQLSHKVRVEEGKLSTVELSSGQRRRLALLGVYLERRSICIFDEWASDQDPIFKEVFYRQVLPDLQAQGRTLVVVTHDDRYFGVADRILKLEDGKLVPTSLPPAMNVASPSRT